MAIVVPATPERALVQSFWVPGPLPGLNEVIAAAKGYGGKGIAYARMKHQWTDAVALLARAARLRPCQRVRLAFEWRERDRRRDPDNVSAAKKFAIDGLVLAKIIPGDGWAHVAGWSDSWSVDAKKPGVLVTIQSV